MKLQYSNKINKIPPYLFAQLDELAQKVISSGKRLYNFGIGDPDMPTVEPIIKAVKKTVEIPDYHRYPSYVGNIKLREKISSYLKDRFNLKMSPEKNIIVLIGSKEGIAHFPFAFINPGEKVFVPEPGYPVYRDGTIFAEGIPIFMPLLKENDFLPDIEHHLKRNQPKIVWVNYPNNPTSAAASDKFYKELIELAHKYNFIIASDAAYIDVYRNETTPPRSILEFDGAMDVAIEFYSFSKMFNMTGWRIGFAIGNEQLISGLGKIKKSIDSGVFDAIQMAVAEELKNGLSELSKIRNIYFDRREKMESVSAQLHLKPYKTNSTFYIWAEILNGMNSQEKVKELLNKYGILVTPGRGFGPSADNYVRFSLTAKDCDINELYDRRRSL